MLQDWMLSEEGWTKSKNWARRLLLLSIFAGMIGGAVAGAASFVMFRVAWTDWERHYVNVAHAEMYWKLREYIYGGRSCWQLFRVPRLTGVLTVFALVWGGVLREHKDRQAKRAGSVEQGPRLVAPEEFNETYHGDGIGLNVKGKGTSEMVRVRIPMAYEPQSVIVLGDTGAGKTVALKQMIDQIEERGDLAVIHDPKADYLPIYFSAKRGDVVLNPFDTRSPFWSPSD